GAPPLPRGGRGRRPASRTGRSQAAAIRAGAEPRLSSRSGEQKRRRPLTSYLRYRVLTTLSVAMRIARATDEQRSCKRDGASLSLRQTKATAVSPRRPRLLPREAVAQSPDGLTESVVRVGSKMPKVVHRSRGALATRLLPSPCKAATASAAQVLADGFVRQPPRDS